MFLELCKVPNQNWMFWLLQFDVMIQESLLFTYKLPYFYLNHLVSLFLFAFVSCIGCSICDYLFPQSNEFIFEEVCII
jgi:hypothetical protein